MLNKIFNLTSFTSPCSHTFSIVRTWSCEGQTTKERYYKWHMRMSEQKHELDLVTYSNVKEWSVLKNLPIFDELWSCHLASGFCLLITCKGKWEEIQILKT